MVALIIFLSTDGRERFCLISLIGDNIFWCKIRLKFVKTPKNEKLKTLDHEIYETCKTTHVRISDLTRMTSNIKFNSVVDVFYDK